MATRRCLGPGVLTVAGALVTVTSTGELPGAAVSCDAGGRVAAVGAPADGGTVLDATGCVVTAGLVNAHAHLLQTAFRTLPGTRGVPMAQWLPTMAAAYRATGVDDELVHAAAAAGLAEALLCGVTAVADHLTWPATTGDGVSLARAVAAAGAETGARVVFVRGSAGDDTAAAAASADAIARALRRRRWPGRRPGRGAADRARAERRHAPAPGAGRAQHPPVSLRT